MNNTQIIGLLQVGRAWRLLMRFTGFNMVDTCLDMHGVNKHMLILFKQCGLQRGYLVAAQGVGALGLEPLCAVLT